MAIGNMTFAKFKRELAQFRKVVGDLAKPDPDPEVIEEFMNRFSPEEIAWGGEAVQVSANVLYHLAQQAYNHDATEEQLSEVLDGLKSLDPVLDVFGISKDSVYSQHEELVERLQADVDGVDFDGDEFPPP